MTLSRGGINQIFEEMSHKTRLRATSSWVLFLLELYKTLSFKTLSAQLRILNWLNLQTPVNVLVKY